ncbi:MAG: hypothetical protein C0520_16145, partial [Sphingopyxis sp.]|nr:hypothetical protein [Sphingopyxis sp.]
LKKPPPKLRLLKLLLKKALTPLLLAPTPLLLVPKLPLPAPKLLLRPTLLPPLLLRLTPLLLRLLRLKKRSKSQPFGAMTETKKDGLPSGRPSFFMRVCGRDRLHRRRCLRPAQSGSSAAR